MLVGTLSLVFSYLFEIASNKTEGLILEEIIFKTIIFSLTYNSKKSLNLIRFTEASFGFVLEE